MIKPEDLLQERLERLEAGETLADCLEGVPEDIAVSLRTAARLSDLDWPTRNPELVTAQRSGVMKAIQKKPAYQEGLIEGQPEKPNNFWTTGFIISAMVAVVVVVIACISVSVLGGTLWFVNRNRISVAEKLPLFAEKAPASGHPEEAALLEVRGLVEVLDKYGEWAAAEIGDTLTASAHLRTGVLSSAALVFYDGSRVSLGPNAEIAIDELQAYTEDGPRQILLTQVLGESQHDVAASTSSNSRYEVYTEAAVGAAKGTQFRVLVRSDHSSLFSVTEGEVAVTGQDVTVLVESGQATTAGLDEPPSEPAYFFTGQGEVTFIGETWVIAGQALITHAGTVVIGNPQVGDQVFFEGRLMPDETRLVDLIVLVRRSPANRFSLTGKVDNIAEDFWTVNGQQVTVTDITEIDEGIDEGDMVYIEGLILPGGTLQAETIRRLEEPPGLPFDFIGVVQAIGDEAWIISNVEVSVNSSTRIDEGLDVGNQVRVIGWILEDGTWQASTIRHALDDTRSFEFVGKIESMDPWIVAGIEFEIAEWTEIDEGLEVGDQVSVRGQVMEDGTWVAYEIQSLEDLTEVRIVLVGVVFNMDPWVVSGVTLPVDTDTDIDDRIRLGMLVRVEIRVLPDGSWKVLSIAPLKGFEWGEGCQELTAVVVSVSGDQLQLQGWPVLTIGENTEIVGELKANSIVLVQVCIGEDGSVQVVYIFIILQPPDEEPVVPEFPGEKVMICHKPNSRNPHVIVVSQSAVPAHLGHGDVLGPCP